FRYFFFQAEDGIRDRNVTGVQTCALPILVCATASSIPHGAADRRHSEFKCLSPSWKRSERGAPRSLLNRCSAAHSQPAESASDREQAAEEREREHPGARRLDRSDP